MVLLTIFQQQMLRSNSLTQKVGMEDRSKGNCTEVSGNISRTLGLQGAQLETSVQRER